MESDLSSDGDLSSDENLSSEEKAQQELMLESVAKSPLFDLPPEIRNTIYRYVLVKTRNIAITKSRGIPEPALLLVSKLVRSETYELFYIENKFKCVVIQFDPACIMLANRRWSALSRIPGTILDPIINGLALDLRGRRNWKNLVAWFRFVHQVTCCGRPARPHDDDAEESLMSGLFETLMHGPGMTASALDFLLQSMRPTFVKLHQDWGKD